MPSACRREEPGGRVSVSRNNGRVTIERLDRITGCLLGGAVGDALGAPVEFWSQEQIDRTFGAEGVRSYHPATFPNAHGIGLITDDTQMTLFTAEGLLRADMRSTAKGICHPPSVVHHAYLRWHATQKLERPPSVLDESGDPFDPASIDGWLAREPWLYSRRAPGATCLTALAEARALGDPANNDSKGCGAVMRSAPFGLIPMTDAPGLAVECAALTHGHPTGQLTAGALTVIVETLMGGRPLDSAIAMSQYWLSEQRDSDETLRALDRAAELAASAASHDARAHRSNIDALGEGWIAEEALAMGVYAALAFPEADQIRDALALAVSHRGDSDSTGSICGNILGALHGARALPADLVEGLEGREAIVRLATDLCSMTDEHEMQRPDPDAWVEHWWDRYPGW